MATEVAFGVDTSSCVVVLGRTILVRLVVVVVDMLGCSIVAMIHSVWYTV